MNPLEIDITVDADVSAPINEGLLRQGIAAAAKHRGFDQGQIGLRVSSDKTIRELNATYLNHDYATDVISFGYTAEKPQIDGEMVVSVDTARVRATEMGWATEHELCLYAVHGTLHITGMDDHETQQRADMRLAEQSVMESMGIAGIAWCGADQDPDCSNRQDGLDQENPASHASHHDDQEQSA